MDPHRILAYMTERAPEMAHVLERLVGMDSPSGNEQAIGRFVSFYRTLIEAPEVRCRELVSSEGPHFLAEVDAGDPGAPPVVLVGHSDTVWPVGEATRRPPRTDDRGRLHGPGVYDMRAGLTVIVFALRFLRESNVRLVRPVKVFLSADEEVGSKSAHPFMEKLFPPASTALILEPPLEDGSLKTRRKGVGMYTITVEGVESHAGIAPERGVSAIVEVARKVLEIVAWAAPSRGVTFNVGQVHGGTATNVVAGRAYAGLDVRFDDLRDGHAIDERLHRLQPHDPGTRITVEGGIIFPPLVPDTRSGELATLAIDLAAGLGLRLSTGRSGGGSDGSFLASKGLAVLDGLGVEGGGAHSKDEHVVLERLPVRAALLAAMVMRLAG